MKPSIKGQETKPGVLSRVFFWTGITWMTAVGVSVLISMAGTLLSADSENLFNVANVVAVLVTVSPGLAALWLSHYIAKKRP